MTVYGPWKLAPSDSTKGYCFAANWPSLFDGDKIYFLTIAENSQGNCTVQIVIVDSQGNIDVVDTGIINYGDSTYGGSCSNAGVHDKHGTDVRPCLCNGKIVTFVGGHSGYGHHRLLIFDTASKSVELAQDIGFAFDYNIVLPRSDGTYVGLGRKYDGSFAMTRIIFDSQGNITKSDTFYSSAADWRCGNQLVGYDFDRNRYIISICGSQAYNPNVLFEYDPDNDAFYEINSDQQITIPFNEQGRELTTYGIVGAYVKNNYLYVLTHDDAGNWLIYQYDQDKNVVKSFTLGALGSWQYSAPMMVSDGQYIYVAHPTNEYQICLYKLDFNLSLLAKECYTVTGTNMYGVSMTPASWIFANPQKLYAVWGDDATPSDDYNVAVSNGVTLYFAQFDPPSEQPTTTETIYDVTITNETSQELTNYAVRIDLDGAQIDWDALANGAPLWFTDEQGNPLYYAIIALDASKQKGTVYVKVPSIPANGSTTIKMHIGGTPPDGYEDPSQVFDVYKIWSSNPCGTEATCDGLTAWDDTYGLAIGGTGDNNSGSAHVDISSLNIGTSWEVGFLTTDKLEYFTTEGGSRYWVVKDTNNNMYDAFTRQNQYANDERLICYDGSQEQTVASRSAPPDTAVENVWFVLRLQGTKLDWYTSNFYIDRMSGTACNPISALEIYASTWQAKIYWKGYFIRKIVNPDPSATITQEQQPPPDQGGGSINVSSDVNTILIGKDGAMIALTYQKVNNANTLQVAVSSQDFTNTVNIDVSSQSVDTTKAYMVDLGAASVINNVIDISQLTYTDKQTLNAGDSLGINNALVYAVANQDSSITISVQAPNGESVAKSYTLIAGDAIAIIAMNGSTTQVKIGVDSGQVTVYVYNIPSLTTEDATITFKELDANNNEIASGSINIQLATVQVTGTPSEVSASQVRLVATIAISIPSSGGGTVQ